MTETKKRDWGWLGYLGATLLGAAVAVIIMLSCRKKEPPADLYAERVNFGWVNIFIRTLSGIKPVTYHEVQAETTILLDTVYVPREVSKFWGMGLVNLNPSPAPSFVQYMAGGRAYEHRFFADTGLNYTYRIWQDSMGVHVNEARLDLPSPKIRHPVLAFCVSGGGQLGQVDTLLRLRPEFETSLKWNITSWLYAKAGLRFPWGAFLNITGDIPLVMKE